MGLPGLFKRNMRKKDGTAIMVRLGDYVKIKTGKLDANASSDNGIYPFFTCSKEPLAIDTYSYDCECVLVSGNGDLNVKYYSGKFDAYQRTYIVESNDKEKLFVRYLYYFLDKYVETLRVQSIGGVIKYIKLGNLTEAKIPLPPLDEQRKIAAVLDKVSDLIAKRRQQLDKLDTLLQSRFIELFGEPLHPLHSQPLGNIAILERGRFSPRPRNDPQYYGGIYPFIQTGDIANCGHRLLNYKQTLNHKGTGVSKKFSAGTIVMAIVGATIGATAILKIDAYAPDSVIGIIVDSNRYNNIFMEILLRFWKPELLRIAPESARANINLAILQTIPIPKVELELQDQFAAFVEQTEKTKTSINRGLEKLETVKKALMQEYFG